MEIFGKRKYTATTEFLPDLFGFVNFFCKAGSTCAFFIGLTCFLLNSRPEDLSVNQSQNYLIKSIKVFFIKDD